MGEWDDLIDPGIRDNSSSTRTDGNLPNANAVLTLGILSIVGCFLYAVPGLICGIIALSLHMKDKRMHAEDPQFYEESFKNSKGGYICAIIGTSLSALFFLGLVIGILIAVSTSPY